MSAAGVGALLVKGLGREGQGGRLCQGSDAEPFQLVVGKGGGLAVEGASLQVTGADFLAACADPGQRQPPVQEEEDVRQRMILLVQDRPF